MDARDTVQRLLQVVMSNGMAVLYNWSGKDKAAFGKLRLVKALTSKNYLSHTKLESHILTT